VCVYSVIVGYCWYCIFNRAGSSISVAISILFDGEDISFHAKPVSLLNKFWIYLLPEFGACGPKNVVKSLPYILTIKTT